MAVSRILAAGGANDFNLSLGGTYTSVTLNKEYASGSYSITSGNNDTTIDIYAYNSDGSSAGYTNTKSFTATKGFNKIVVLGGQSGDVLGFAYKTTFTTTDDSDEVTAGPVVTSISPSDMPKINDTITITGRNFASDVAITFTGTGYSSTAAKNVVRSSATSLIVTRPDNFPISASPFTITASNPGISNPTGSNSHILSNAVTAGNAPVWSTAATLPSYTRNVAYSTTLVATDSSDAGSTISYSIVSGLPTGLSLSTAGVLSGTSTASTPLTGIVVRATDSGGNFVDRTFTIPNTGPVWSTTGALTNATNGTAYSFTLSAPDDSGSTPTFALVSGSLPTGLSLASNGVISGTPTGSATSSFVVSATDGNGVSVNSGTLSIYVQSLQTVRLTSSGTFTAPSTQTISLVLVGGGGSGGKYYGSGNVGSGGGGAGGVVEATLAVTGGNTYSYTIGGGGALISGGGSSGGASHGNKGTDTTFAGVTTAVGGGAGGGSQISASGWNTSPFTGYGGSGGGGGESYSRALGTSGQGSNGGTTGGQWSGGGGGGKTGQGGDTTGSSSNNAGGGGSGGTYLTYSIGGGGGGGMAAGQSPSPGAGGSGGGGAGGKGGNAGSGTAFTGGGGGGSDSTNNSGAGGSGCVIIQYLG